MIHLQKYLSHDILSLIFLRHTTIFNIVFIKYEKVNYTLLLKYTKFTQRFIRISHLFYFSIQKKIVQQSRMYA